MTPHNYVFRLQVYKAELKMSNLLFINQNEILIQIISSL